MKVKLFKLNKIVGKYDLKKLNSSATIPRNKQ